MQKRSLALTITFTGLLFSASPSHGRSPRRQAPSCSPRATHCKPAPKPRLMPCPGDPSRLCTVMRGDSETWAIGQKNTTLTWQAVPGATHYRIKITGYNTEWQSEDIWQPSFDYGTVALRRGRAYFVTITAYSHQRRIQSTEQAINIPATVTTSSR